MCIPTPTLVELRLMRVLQMRHELALTPDSRLATPDWLSSGQLIQFHQRLWMSDGY